MKPYSNKHLTDAEIKKFVETIGEDLFSASGRYELCGSVEEARLFIENNLNRTFYCKAIQTPFVLSVHTVEHFFGKSRSNEDYLRRSKLLASGLEILEESQILVVIDRVLSIHGEIITYYEILGTDKRLPGKIINAKLSEIKAEGKIFWTVVDINITKTTNK